MEWSARADISEEQQVQLERHERTLRINNEKYFRVHPELRVMVAEFMKQLLEQKPDDVRRPLSSEHCAICT